MTTVLAATSEPRPRGDVASRAILALWPVLLSLPALVLEEGSLLLLLALMLPCVAFLFLRRLSVGSLITSWGAVGVLVLAVCVSVAIFRAPDELLTTNAKLAQGATVCLFSVLALFAFAEPSARAERFRSLLWSLPIYIAFNFALYLADPGQQAELSITRQNANVILSTVGIVQPRLQHLPTVSGSAVIGTLCALSLLSLVQLRRIYRKGRPFAFALMIPSVAGLVLADTRSLIVVTAAVLAIYLTLRTRRLRSILRFGVVFAAFSAPLLLGAFNAAEAIGLGEVFGRSADLGSRLGAGTGRTLIWNGVFTELSHFRAEHFFGYGQYGDLKTGVSASYAWIFYGRDGHPSYHNTALQYVLESGYFVAALYFVVIWLAVNRVSAGREPEAKSALGLLLIVLAAGCTEVAGTPLHFETFLFTLGVIAFCLTAPISAGRGAGAERTPTAG